MTSMTSDSTRSSLIRRVQANDHHAWNRLTQLYGPLVYGWCKQAGLQAADISDIAQEVFTAVYQNVKEFRRSLPTDSFRGWLWTITRNQVRLHFRRRTGEPQATGGTDAQAALEQYPDLFAPESLPDAISGQHRTLHRALRILREDFTEQTWKAFWRCSVDGLSGAQVAQELQMSPGAVRQAKYMVLKQLREFLADD